MFTRADEHFMARALRLAQYGLFTTTPNPRVGCVVVRGGAIVGEGFHERAGEPHAEIRARRLLASALPAPPPTSTSSPAATTAGRRHASMR